MLKTYTLYLRDGVDRVRFEPSMCRTDAEAMARARKLLELNPECKAVEVLFGNDLLFRINR